MRALMAENQKAPSRIVEHVAADGCLLAGVAGFLVGVYMLWGAGVTLLVGGTVLAAVGLAFGRALGRGGP